MANLIPLNKFLDNLRCPYTKEDLEIDGNSLCSSGFHFEIVDGIPNLVSIDQIDPVVEGEIEGNSFVETLDEKLAYAEKYESDDEHIGSHYIDRDLRIIVPILKSMDCNSLLFLGVGGGMEVRRILRKMDVQTVFCSDLVVSKCQVVPMALAEFNVELGLFASDLSNVPWKNTKTPLIINQALHHVAQNYQTCLESILSDGYENVVIAEPCGNVIITVLAKIGVAQRIEPTGVKPARMDLNSLKKIAETYDYKITTHTNWVVPPDYLQKFSFGIRPVEKLWLIASDLLSKIFGVFNIGNNCIVHFEKK